MSIKKKLVRIANVLDSYTSFQSEEIDSLAEAASDIGKSWSGSWLGYHSRVYYKDFITPPPGAVFSQAWGFKDGTRGEWCEYIFDDVVSLIEKKAGNPSIQGILSAGDESAEAFDRAKSSVLSLVHSSFDSDKDKYLTAIIDKIEKLKIFQTQDFTRCQQPTGQLMSSDIIALEKGLVPPPHITVLSRAFAAKQPFESCGDLKKLIIKLANHV